MAVIGDADCGLEVFGRVPWIAWRHATEKKAAAWRGWVGFVLRRGFRRDRIEDIWAQHGLAVAVADATMVLVQPALGRGERIGIGRIGGHHWLIGLRARIVGRVVPFLVGLRQRILANAWELARLR